MADTPVVPAVAPHGSHRLPAVDVDSYNVELKDDEGFIGDRASKGAFRNMIENIRKTLRKSGEDPLGEEDSDELSKAELDSLLLQGAPEAAGIIHAAIEDFSQEFALIIPALPEIERMEEHRTNRRWWGLSGKPNWGTRYRPHDDHSQNARDRRRACAYS